MFLSRHLSNPYAGIPRAKNIKHTEKKVVLSSINSCPVCKNDTDIKFYSAINVLSIIVRVSV